MDTIHGKILKVEYVDKQTIFIILLFYVYKLINKISTKKLLHKFFIYNKCKHVLKSVALLDCLIKYKQEYFKH